MASAKLIAVLAALALSGVLAPVAHAESMNTDPNKVLAERNQWAPLSQHKSIEWDAAKSRFGFKVDVDQQPGLAGGEWKNVQAGAYFKITPSLRVGAGVSLNDQPTNVANANPMTQQPVPPKVHFETAWKF